MPTAERPNILLITTDQQRFDTLQCAGNPNIWTPHLNWLADNGIRFTNAYSDCPVCMPARVTMMTGQHAATHGVMSNKFRPEAVRPEYSLPGLLTSAGYQTRLLGKTHFGPERVNQGFEHMEVEEDYYRYMEKNQQLGRPRGMGIGSNEHAPTFSTLAPEHTATAWLAQRGCDFMETRDPSRPFFLQLNFHHPHPPFESPQEYWELYRDTAMPAPVYGNWSTSESDIPPAFLGVTYELSMTQRLAGKQLEQLRRAYYACVTEVDYQLGLLFAQMHELNIFENTIVIFTSDHGEMLGDHFMGGKCVPFEASVHIPLLIRMPGTLRNHHRPWRGVTNDALVCLADILPTCLNFADVPIPEEAGVEGIDMLAVARQEVARERLFLDCMYMHAVREGDYKLCRETLQGHELLFNVAEDPYDTRDLLRTHEADEIAGKLRAALDEHLELHDLCGVDKFDPAVATDASQLPFNVHPGFAAPWGKLSGKR